MKKREANFPSTERVCVCTEWRWSSASSQQSSVAMGSFRGGQKVGNEGAKGNFSPSCQKFNSEINQRGSSKLHLRRCRTSYYYHFLFIHHIPRVVLVVVVLLLIRTWTTAETHTQCGSERNWEGFRQTPHTESKKKNPPSRIPRPLPLLLLPSDRILSYGRLRCEGG